MDYSKTYKRVKLFGKGLTRFPNLFTSPAFCVIVGPRKKAYYPHKQVLIDYIPYFASLLNGKFQGIEAANGSVTLDSPVDTEAAFEAVLEYVYLDSYTPEWPFEANRQCLFNAQVYVLAERLCMEDLKNVTLEKMFEHLPQMQSDETFNTSTTSYAWTTPESKKRFSSLASEEKTTREAVVIEKCQKSLETLVSIVELVYNNTPDAADQGTKLNEAGTSDRKEKGYHSAGYTSDTTKARACAPIERVVHRKDEMRTLICRYLVSRLDEVKTCSPLMTLVEMNGDLARDLLMAAAPGKALQKDDLGSL